MTTYELPTEPAGPVWTSTDGVAQRWNNEGGIWTYPGTAGGAGLNWAGLLRRHGPATDNHPELPQGAPLPWSLHNRHEVFDAEDALVYRVSSDDAEPTEKDAAILAFVVRAANAYAEQLSAGSSEVPAARPLPDSTPAVVELVHLWDRAPAVVELVHLWDRVTSERRAAVDAECGGLVRALNQLATAAHRRGLHP